MRRTLIGLLATLLLAVFLASPAQAHWTPTPGGNPPDQQPVTDTTSGSSGNAARTSTHSCSLYANSTSFGVSCYSGGSDRSARTVRKILGKGVSKDFCWDVVIPADELTKNYGYTVDASDPYYLHSCVTGLIEKNSPWDQPNVVLSQSVIRIHQVDEHPCSADPGKDQLYPAIRVGTCIMTLTGGQQQIAGLLQSDGAQIPGIVLTTHPSTKIRTNEWVAYTDSAEGGMTTTPRYHVGAVTMWAQMNRFSIHPYGPNGPDGKVCDGTANISDDDAVNFQPPAGGFTPSDPCWWAYPQSSAGQPGDMYPFRAEADWTVYYDAGAGPQALASFQKYTDLREPVFDIQTIVVGVE